MLVVERFDRRFDAAGEWIICLPQEDFCQVNALPPEGRYHLTPLYDVMSIWPVESDGANQWSWHKAKLAMAISGTGKSRHYAFREIKRRHFNAMAVRCGYGPSAEPLVERIIERTLAVIDTVNVMLPDGFPARVAERIFRGMRESARLLDAMPAE